MNELKPTNPSMPETINEVIEPTRRQWLGFWCMITQQTQNAFNDKMAQFILIPLGGAIGFSVESAAGLLIALPFVLFAPLAGWVSDRFSKRNVLFGSAVLQLLVLLLICTAILMKNLPMALGGFFALAVQAAFFSPAKLGINKELVGSNHLGFATGIQQMTTMLAMLAGQIVAGWWFDHRYHALGGNPNMAWQAALGPMWILTALSVPALLLAWLIPRVPTHGKCGKLSWGLSLSHFTSLKELWGDAPLRQASLGVAFFWGFAAFINLWSVKLAKILTGGGEGFGTTSSLFMAAASLGMAAGFGFASYLLRRRIELGWVPVAGGAMTIFSLVIGLMPSHGVGFLVVLGMLAFSGALFLVPINAWMQDRYPAAKRGELQAASNLQDCLAGIIAVGIIAVFEMGAAALGVSPLNGFRFQMVFVSLACFTATCLIIRLLPADFIRLLSVAAVRMIYRIRIHHAQRVPEKGGVLLLPNHVTYVDAFLISAGCSRPVRFVMDEAFMEQRAIRVFTNIFETMTIRREQPLEAIRAVIRALKQGDVVCLFPEGQLTRTGTLCTLQRGFELIARKADHPLIPVWVDGSWGSLFSFERNCFFRKMPHRLKLGITLAFGEAISPDDADLESVRDGILKASAEAIERRFRRRQWSRRVPRTANPASQAFRCANENQRRRWWINGYQIGMINGLPRRHSFYVLASDPILKEIPGLCAGFSELWGAELHIREHFLGDDDAVWVGGDPLRNEMQVTQITGKIAFYDFGAHALTPVERAGLSHFPCLAVDGIVVSMSMPHPPQAADRIEDQLGHKLGSWGKLLPGCYVVRSQDEAPLRVHGPAAPENGLALPKACSLDAEGFLTRN